MKIRTETLKSAWIAVALTLPVGAMAGEIWSKPTYTKTWSQPTYTRQWSQPGATQRWAAPSANRRPWSTAPTTRQWAPVVTTRRRSDADIQRQVDRITANARAKAAAGGVYSRHPRAGNVPDQVWRQHRERTRADAEFQREQDSYYARQRYYQAR